jgi:dTDP-4-dehydrorhamnose reductase
MNTLKNWKEENKLKILLFGSSGQLGQEFEKMEGLNICAVDHESLDIRSANERCNMIRTIRPDVVINCTAFHRVDECELNPTTSHSMNTMVPAWLASECQEIKAKLVHISTDYVFGGDPKRNQLYTEEAPVSPINTYGLTKALGEKLIQAGMSNYLIIRTSALFGAATSRKGWTFPEMVIERAKAGEELEIVKDQITVPTYSKDLALKIMELIHEDKPGIFHCVSEGEHRLDAVSWCEFALATLQMANVAGSVKPVKTLKTHENRAWRPNFSAMTSIKLNQNSVGFMRSWKEALRDYLTEKGY